MSMIEILIYIWHVISVSKKYIETLYYILSRIFNIHHSRLC